MAKVTAALADLGCKDPKGVKEEQEGLYEIDDAKCKMGTMDIELDKDFKIILISRYLAATPRATTQASHRRHLSGPTNGGPHPRPVFFFASPISCRPLRERRQALNCKPLRILPCTSARVYATLNAWRPT